MFAANQREKSKQSGRWTDGCTRQLEIAIKTKCARKESFNKANNSLADSRNKPMYWPITISKTGKAKNRVLINKWKQGGEREKHNIFHNEKIAFRMRRRKLNL